MDTYFKFKMVTEYIIPIAIIAIVIVAVIISSIISAIKSSRIEKFFLTNGYERKLFRVPSFGDGAFYGWVRESDGKRVDNRDIRGWSFKQIKDKYK